MTCPSNVDRAAIKAVISGSAGCCVLVRRLNVTFASEVSCLVGGTTTGGSGVCCAIGGGGVVGGVCCTAGVPTGADVPDVGAGVGATNEVGAGTGTAGATAGAGGIAGAGAIAVASS